MKIMNINDIIIPKLFRLTRPHSHKINRVKHYVKKYGKLDKPIVLYGNTLVDNYTRYIVALSKGMEEISCVDIIDCFGTKDIYIQGKFEGCDKVYSWKLDKPIPITIGSKVIVEVKNTTDIVDVVGIYTANRNSDYATKFVVDVYDGQT